MGYASKKRLGKVLVLTVLVLLSAANIFPLLWMIRSSFMRSEEIFAQPMHWLPQVFMPENYSQAMTSAPFPRYFLNSSFLVIMNILGNLFSASLAAYGFSRIQFKGREFFFNLCISTMMIPGAVMMIPQFFIWKMVGAYNTYLPLILPSFLLNAFFIFLLRQFFRTLPIDYDESAMIDGASPFVIYARIIMPLSRPALMTVGVFTFMGTWNDFMGPLLYLSRKEMFTVSLGLQSFIGQYATKWNLMMAAATVAVVPMIVIFFFAQRAFIEGITFTGLKG